MNISIAAAITRKGNMTTKYRSKARFTGTRSGASSFPWFRRMERIPNHSP